MKATSPAPEGRGKAQDFAHDGKPLEKKKKKKHDAKPTNRWPGIAETDTAVLYIKTGVIRTIFDQAEPRSPWSVVVVLNIFGIFSPNNRWFQWSRLHRTRHES